VVTAEELGGAQSQMSHSGVIHLIAQNDDEALQLCRVFSALCLQQHGRPAAHGVQSAARVRCGDECIVPIETKMAYDVRGVVIASLTIGLSRNPAEFRPNIVIGFGRLQGRPSESSRTNPMCCRRAQYRRLG